MNKILFCYLLLIFGNNAYGQDIYFFNVHDKRLGFGSFNYEQAYLDLGNSDVVHAVNFCAPDTELECLISFGNFIVFAVPRETLSEGMGWEFAGYKFKILQIRNVMDDSITLIESLPNYSSADGNGNRLPASVTFLYSKKYGIVQFNNMHTSKNAAGEVLGEYQYVFLGSGLDIKRFEQIGPVDNRFDQDAIVKLKAPNLSPLEIDEVVKLGRQR